MRVVEKLKAAGKHLFWSAVVAAVVAALVFGVWYPSPYGALAGGFALFGLVVAVDVVCGPLLTAVVYNSSKPRSELVRDIGIIVLLQLAALVYGVYSVAQARPIYLAYEGNRYRVVSMADVDKTQLEKAPAELRSPGFAGPRLLGAKLAEGTDADFQSSVILSMQGLHPAYRPERWVPYESLLPELQEALEPIAKLKEKNPDAASRIDEELKRQGLAEQDAGYLPVDAEKATSPDWVAIVERKSGQPKAFMPINGW